MGTDAETPCVAHYNRPDCGVHVLDVGPSDSDKRGRGLERSESGGTASLRGLSPSLRPSLNDRPSYAGLPLTRLGIRGVGGFVLACTPLSWGVPAAAGVGADADPSSSFLTPEGLRRLLL